MTRKRAAKYLCTFPDEALDLAMARQAQGEPMASCDLNLVLQDGACFVGGRRRVLRTAELCEPKAPNHDRADPHLLR